MKAASFRISMTAIVALALMATTHTARAQEPLLVNIPFAFTAGRMTLRPGEYRVQKMAYDSPALLIQRADQSAATVVTSFTAEANAKQAQSKLVFHRCGNRYFLFQVWTVGSERGRELPKSSPEQEQGLAAHNQMPDQVTIVARLVAPKP